MGELGELRIRNYELGMDDIDTMDLMDLMDKIS